MMRVILTEDVPHLGVVGDLVNVRDGFGRNFLIPQKKAVLASARSVRELEHQKRLAAHQREKAKTWAEAAKGKIESLSIVIQAKVAAAPVTPEGATVAPQDYLQKLFGSITNRELGSVLQNLGYDIDHRRIAFSDQVRTVGKFVAAIRLDGGVKAQVPFWVIPEGAADPEAEKKRVEAAQDSLRKQAEAEAAAERAKLAAEKAKDKAREKEKAKEAEGAAAAAPADAAPPAADEAKPKKKKKEAAPEA